MTGEPRPPSTHPTGETAATPRTPRLDNLPTAPRLTTAQAAAHTLLVKRLKVLLPAAACLLVVIFLANAGRGGADDVMLDDFADIDGAAEELRMARPHFTGVDADGAPFDITADAAIRLPGQEDQVTLEAPRAISGDEKKRSTISAKHGDYSDETKILVLTEDVVFEHQLGEDTYVLNTPDAVFSIDDETVVSEAGVAGEGPRGAALTADRMYADNKTNRVVFEGNVKTRIYPDRENAACEEAESDDASPDSAKTGEDCSAKPKNGILTLGDRLR
ncbi:MAG: LPS export ABC transporter periplasmic protein LptC [Pseudomonadota bacterium]